MHQLKDAIPVSDDFTLLYADASLLVANKPSRLLSVPGRGEEKQDCLIRRVQTEYRDALIVHRLDYDTSGLLVLAMTGVFIGIGKMTVFAFQMQHFQQVFQFILSQLWA